MSGIIFVLYFVSICILGVVVGVEGDEEDRRPDWYTDYIPQSSRSSRSVAIVLRSLMIENTVIICLLQEPTRACMTVLTSHTRYITTYGASNMPLWVPSDDLDPYK